MAPPSSGGILTRAYRRHVLPSLVHRVCSGAPFSWQRRRVVPGAWGDVLEVGMGSGLNLPFYDGSRVRRVWGLDPDPEMARRARAEAAQLPFEVQFVMASAEEIPLPDSSADSAVVTWALCSIPDLVGALREVARVLKPGGRLFFCEHGLAPDMDVRRWQRTLTPVWRRLSGGCHLDRDVPECLAAGGFRVERLECGYLPVWRPAGYNTWGSAVAR